MTVFTAAFSAVAFYEGRLWSPPRRMVNFPAGRKLDNCTVRMGP